MITVIAWTVGGVLVWLAAGIPAAIWIGRKLREADAREARRAPVAEVRTPREWVA